MQLITLQQLLEKIFVEIFEQPHKPGRRPLYYRDA
jgi:hypothetical protein